MRFLAWINSIYAGSEDVLDLMYGYLWIYEDIRREVEEVVVFVKKVESKV